jgi:hypothetical protein
MLHVIMMSFACFIVMLNVIMLNVIMLNVVMLSVFMLNVIMRIVVAPFVDSKSEQQAYLAN